MLPSADIDLLCTNWDSQSIHAADIEMATLEKLVRTVEALKLHQTPSVTVDETMAKKDKIAHCISVTDMICSQVVLNIVVKI